MKTIGEELAGISSSKLEMNKSKYLNKIENNNMSSLNKNIIKNKNKQIKIIKLNDYEINVLDYKQAIKIDKRSYPNYYFSLLRRKELLIFTFYTSNDYNSKIIKICLFLFSFSSYYTVNALFFNDITMHKIYEDQGSYNFIYQIPQILYSSLICSVINIIVTALSLSEKNILSIKKETVNIEEKICKVLKFLKIKFTFFFLLIFLFLSFFWYYISCFGAVYKNTQIHLIKDTLISFSLSLFYPIFLCLIPGIFRIPALRAPKQNKEFMYKFSKIIQLL